jgi:hypothetical protein
MTRPESKLDASKIPLDLDHDLMYFIIPKRSTYYKVQRLDGIRWMHFITLIVSQIFCSLGLTLR